MIVTSRIQHFLDLSISLQVSDLHLSVNTLPIGRIDGALKELPGEVFTEESMNNFVEETLTEEEYQYLKTNRSLDCAVSCGTTRFRINIYYERGYLAWAIRRLEDKIRTVKELNLPEQLLDLAKLKDGLVLFTGPTGSGKSTSLATILNYINENRSCHILTIEDPIEYLHYNKKSLVHQRELGTDVTSFSNSLREALREDPDVILVGEMRDLDTMRAALTAAETGHLVFSTLHCADTVGSLDRILAMYPAEEQESIQRQLAMTLKAVVAQRLMPGHRGKGRYAAIEILKVNNSVGNLIRTAQFNQIYSVLETSRHIGMQSIDSALSDLVCKKRISEEVALTAVRNQDFFFESIRLTASRRM
ncbi:MAG: PilT/PilU family type 4a pilus ATPase [Lentisphaeraceae bacterium]|nr:PilT/PilU family type 4a pilus ATPase [Lentisphaeraceae bacterium]